jgi:hypothetical protein
MTFSRSVWLIFRWMGAKAARQTLTSSCAFAGRTATSTPPVTTAARSKTAAMRASGGANGSSPTAENERLNFVTPVNSITAGISIMDLHS